MHSETAKYCSKVDKQDYMASIMVKVIRTGIHTIYSLFHIYSINRQRTATLSQYNKAVIHTLYTLKVMQKHALLLYFTSYAYRIDKFQQRVINVSHFWFKYDL